MTDFEIRIVPEQHIAAMRFKVPMTAIAEAMGLGFAKVHDAIAAAGLTPAGAPLARYHSFGGPIIEFECAIPTATPFAGDGEGEVQASILGGGEAAVGTHIGSYDGIGATWEAISAWVAAQGREVGGPGWESYLTDPSEQPDPAKWVTEVCLPLT